MKSIKDIQKAILKADTGKTELNASDVSRVLAHVSDILHKGDAFDIASIFIKNGRRRAK